MSFFSLSRRNWRKPLFSITLGLLFIFGTIFHWDTTGNLFAQKSVSESPSGSLTAKDFIESRAGKHLQRGEYEKALGEINQMLEKNYSDSLLLRYKGIALARIGRFEEAITIFKDLLSENPTHIPTRYFLAETYTMEGQADLARQEWRWVASQAEGTPYEAWAQSFLAQTSLVKGVQDRVVAVSEIPRWNIYAKYGYEYDDNVILKPNDKSLASTRDQNAGRQVFDLSLKYRAYQKRDLLVDLQYSVSQTVHDDSLDEFNFHSEEFSMNVRKRLQIRDQEYVAGARYDFLMGFLGTNLFSVRNRFKLSLDTRYTAQTRTVFYDRIVIANFGPEGPTPSLTSRDGFSNDVGVTHYIFSSDFKDYLFLRGEFHSVFTQGRNFDKVGLRTRIGIHKVLMERLDLDASIGARFETHHNFSSISTLDTSRRRGIRWDTYTALTYHLTPNLGLRGFYQYIDRNNQNNFFDHDRQIGGAQVIYSQSF